MPDKGVINAEWYPLNYNDFSTETPIVIYLCGIFGNSKERYVKEMADQVEKIGWRFVLLNRRGFDFRDLQTSTFLDKGDTNDYLVAIKKIKQIYNAPLYLVGVSAGSNYAAKLLGLYGRDVPIISFVSISNPFNFNKCS